MQHYIQENLKTMSGFSENPGKMRYLHTGRIATLPVILSDNKQPRTIPSTVGGAQLSSGVSFCMSPGANPPDVNTV